MGFSLHFIRIKNAKNIDADKEGIAQFLNKRNLSLTSERESTSFLDEQGNPLEFDGYFSDIHFDALDCERNISGGIWHATLSTEECEFIYNLCVAGKMMILNPQGDPTYIF